MSSAMADTAWEPPAFLTRPELIKISDRVLAMPDLPIRRTEEIVRIQCAGLDWDISAIVTEPEDSSKIPTGPDGRKIGFFLLHGGAGDYRVHEALCKMMAQKYGIKSVNMTYPGRFYFDDPEHNWPGDTQNPDGSVRTPIWQRGEHIGPDQYEVVQDSSMTKTYGTLTLAHAKEGTRFYDRLAAWPWAFETAIIELCKRFLPKSEFSIYCHGHSTGGPFSHMMLQRVENAVGIAGIENSPFGYIWQMVNTNVWPRPFNEVVVRTWRDIARYRGAEALKGKATEVLRSLPEFIEKIYAEWHDSTYLPQIKAEYVIHLDAQDALTESAEVTARRLGMTNQETADLVARYRSYPRPLTGDGVKPLPPLLYVITANSRDHSREAYFDIILPALAKIDPAPKARVVQFDAGVHSYQKAEEGLPRGLVPVALDLWVEAIHAGYYKAQSRVIVGSTGYFTPNTYAQSDAEGYVNGSQTYGGLGYYDYHTGQLVPMLAESWQSIDPLTWIFKLRRDVKWRDGSPVTAADVVHSHWRQMNDKSTRQISNGKDVKTIEAIDDHTIKVTTAQPIATLLFSIVDRLTITSKAMYDQYGPEVADRDHPMGFGPYKIAQLTTGRRMVLQKDPGSVFAVPNSPDELIFQVMKEPEQRVTALLNKEIQIALYVPPHMIDRIKSSSNSHVAVGPGIEVNFLIMNPTIPPWDNKKLRQAVNYAIDKDSIIENILGTLADRLDGPIGAGQYGYDPNLTPKYTYDPERAKALVREAGFPNGVSVDLYSTINRYTNDKQTSDAIAQMLRAVGIKATLKTPEWAKYSADAEAGRLGMYYLGRGSVVDPSPFLSQYFETGVTTRTMYSNPALDKLLVQERASLDETQRKKVLNQAMSLLNDDAPAAFLWRMRLIAGISNSIDFTPAGTVGIRANDITVKR
eukprot:gene1465-1486_t